MTEKSVSLSHIVLKPAAASQGKSPLLVLLHGVGSNEEDLMGLAPYLDKRLLIVSLRGPLTLGPGAYGWYMVEWTNDGIKHDQEGAIRGQAAAEEAIEQIIDVYDVDSSRVYLMGFSQGAIMSLGITLTHPELVAGAVIMSGRLLPSSAANAAEPERLTGKPIMVVHGTLDNVLPVESGREIESYLKHTPVDLTYREYPMPHTVSQESLNDIANWLTGRLNKPVL